MIPTPIKRAYWQCAHVFWTWRHRRAWEKLQRERAARRPDRPPDRHMGEVITITFGGASDHRNEQAD